MERFMLYWDNVSSAERLLMVMGGMLLFWIIESWFTLIPFKYKRYRHAGVNMVFLASSMVLNLALGYVTVKVADYVSIEKIGLFNLLNWPLWVEVILALFFMDFFSQYAPHWMMHKIKWMWKFHMVHHSDTHVDVTTGTRHHPGEWIFREAGTILGVYLLGIPIGMYFLYRGVSAFFTHFNHANIRMPSWLDRLISTVLVSPNMHKAHHHFERPLTDTNYANIFSLWDRLFGTFAYVDPRTLRYGLDVLDASRDEDLGYQMGMPFRKNESESGNR